MAGHRGSVQPLSKKWPAPKRNSSLHKSLEESLGVYFFRLFKKKLFHKSRRKPLVFLGPGHLKKRAFKF
jgi:hypothetical protein